jgi:hypothetical protein
MLESRVNVRSLPSHGAARKFVAGVFSTHYQVPP